MDAPTRCWALKQLETLCTSLGTSAKERFAPLATRWEAIMGVAMVLTAQMEGEEETAFLSILLSDDGRVQLGDTLAAHMRVAPQRFQEECVLWEGELQRGFAEVFMTDLLNDPNYRVRARMADKVSWCLLRPLQRFLLPLLASLRVVCRTHWVLNGLLRLVQPNYRPSLQRSSASQSEICVIPICRLRSLFCLNA
jgi:hypothetical protein